MLLRSTLLIALLAGCPEPTLPECDVLDTSSVMLVASDNDGHITNLTDGSPVPLIGAPQGGHIVLVGARVKAAHDCQLVATASLRDTATNRVIGLEQRPLLLEQQSSGWASPRTSLDAMPNVAVCPSSAATTNVYNHAYQLEVALATLDETPIVTATVMVVPTCNPSDGFCEDDCGLSP